MEFQTLTNFIVIAEAGNITNAAKQLHISQPALSRQLKDLESELGITLVIRGTRHIQLTDSGHYLLHRAKELVAMADKTKKDLIAQDMIGGDLYIGAGETVAMKIVATAVKDLRDRYPKATVHLFSGNSDDLRGAMETGFLDFCLIVDPANKDNYDFIRLPVQDTWGVLMRQDDALAANKTISPTDLEKIEALYPRQHQNLSGIEAWLGHAIQPTTIIGTYNLLYNAATMVQAGVGVAVCLDQLIETTARTNLVFRPLSPTVKATLSFAWRRDRVLSSVANAFLTILRQTIESSKEK